jgi:hypothetical protein
MNFITTFLPFFLSEQQELKERINTKIADCKRQFALSVNLPRKQKKYVRKKLNLEYSIHVWSKKQLINF